VFIRFGLLITPNFIGCFFPDPAFYTFGPVRFPAGLLPGEQFTSHR
jgi:hypothetical protein